jgi:hypothetical protein
MKVSFKGLLVLLGFLLWSPLVLDVSADEDTIAIENVIASEEETSSEQWNAPLEGAPLQPRSFDKQQLEDYKKQSRYNYDDDPKYENSVSRRLLLSLLDWIDNTFGNRAIPVVGKLLKWLMLGLGVLA